MEVSPRGAGPDRDVLGVTADIHRELGDPSTALARTFPRGGGIVFVTPVEHAIKIRTGDQGPPGPCP